MSDHAERTQAATRAFLALTKGENLRAVAFSGPWGTGKTYLVRDFVATHAKVLQDAKLKFAYVSLFGVQSLAEVRARLAAAAIETEKGTSLAKWGKKLAVGGYVPAEVNGFDISKVGDIAKEFVENRVLKDLFVCVDDLERAGAGLRAVDVLGLISELTEQRGCKVLLVLNREKLADNSIVRLFEEKVFDLTIDYRPSPADVMHLALKSPKERAIALPLFAAFGSANIRVMKRLAWVLDELRKVKVPGRDLIWPKVVRQASILTLLKFERALPRESFKAVLERNEGVLLLREMRKGDRDNPPVPDEFSDLLDQIDHGTEAYDRHIVDLLHDGSLDARALQESFREAMKGTRVNSLKHQAEELTSSLRGGLQLTAAQKAAQIMKFLEGDLSTLHAGTVTVLCDLLVTLDPSPAAAGLVARVLTPIWTPLPVEKRKDQLKGFPTLWAAGIVQKIPHQPSHQEPTVQEAFDEIAADPAGWDTEKLPRLAKASDEELRLLFTTLNTPDAMFRIRRFRERLARADHLSPEERTKLGGRVDHVIAGIAASDPLFKYQLQHFARPRSQ